MERKSFIKSDLIKIIVRQNGKEIPLRKEYDKMIWSGLSWGAAEIDHASINPRQPLEVTGISMENDELKLEANIYAVRYEPELK